MIMELLAFELSSVNDILLLVLVLAGPIMAAYGIFQLVTDLRGTQRDKIVGRLRGQSTQRRKDSTGFGFEDLRRKNPEMAGSLGQILGRLSVTGRLQTMMEQANVNYSAAQFLVNLWLAAAVTFAILAVIGFPLLATIGVCGAVFVLPILWLVRRRKKRLQRLVHQLPDVFELLGQALRAGHSLASAMQLVSQELPDPAGTEFGRVFQEQNLGLKIEDALQNLANRVGVLDVRFFVTAVLIQRQTGGDLAEVLDKISSVIRDRIKLFGTVQALTAEGRLSGYVLLALPVVVFLVMTQINPEYAMVLLTDPTGQMMTTFAVVMQLMGWAMIKKIINIKV